jgi:hypothetical protein
LRSPNSSANQQDARDSESGRPANHDTHLTLEICRGRTEHPLRPVLSPRFLIGSSARCDLRLGGAEIPPLVAMIFQDGSDTWLEAIAPAPALRVNNRVETSVRLSDGDRIAIGAIEFIAHVPEESAIPASVREAINLELNAEEDESEVSEMSAAELVERIEAATEMVNEFEERQRLGVEALHAALQGRELKPATVEPASNSVLPIAAAAGPAANRPLVDLETLVVQLSGVVAELEKRTGAERRRETEYLDAVSTLFETQDRLSRQLEILLRRVASLNAERSGGREQGRAIA